MSSWENWTGVSLNTDMLACIAIDAEGEGRDPARKSRHPGLPIHAHLENTCLDEPAGLELFAPIEESN